MNSQNDSAKLTGGNVSELEMVGTLLFGSIADENEESQPCAQMKSGNSGRKVNLGSRIAPETSRQWEAAEPETVLSSQDASTISGLFPGRQNPAPISSVNETFDRGSSVSETQETIHSASPARKTSWVSRVYGVSMIFMTLCVVVLGWQLLVEKKGESKDAVPGVSTSPSEMVQMDAPMVPAIEGSMIQTPESVFAVMPVEDASKLADPEPMIEQPEIASNLPDVNMTVGQGMNEAPVNQAYGGSVEIDEEYPTFNAELAGVANTPAYTPDPNVRQTPAYNPAPVVAPAPAVNPAPAVTPAPAVNPAPAYNPNPDMVFTGTTWSAGESMDEVPVFNSEISNFNAAPTAPQMAPTAPQVGTQAPMLQTVPLYNAPEPSPRKLTPPAAGHTDPNAAVQPSAPVYSASTAEEVPTFNPNLGVDGALPVSYY